MVHHTLARPEMEAAWRRKAAYADKDTSIFLENSEEYDVKKRIGVDLQPCIRIAISQLSSTLDKYEETTKQKRTHPETHKNRKNT